MNKSNAAAEAAQERYESTRQSSDDYDPLLTRDTAGYVDGFNIVVFTKIGGVAFTDDRGVHPVEAAMTIIGRYCAANEVAGEFQFPHEDGGRVFVHVDRHGR